MALTKEITKTWPTLGNRNMFKPGIRLILKEDLEVVVDETYTRDYPRGGDVDVIKEDLIAMAQTRVDRYKAEKQIYNAAAYDNAVADINTGVIL